MRKKLWLVEPIEGLHGDEFIAADTVEEALGIYFSREEAEAVIIGHGMVYGRRERFQSIKFVGWANFEEPAK